MVERPSCNTHVSLGCQVDESQLDTSQIRTTSRRSIALTFSSKQLVEAYGLARESAPLHGSWWSCWYLALFEYRMTAGGSRSLLIRQPAATAIADVDNMADQLGDLRRVQGGRRVWEDIGVCCREDAMTVSITKRRSDSQTEPE